MNSTRGTSFLSSLQEFFSAIYRTLTKSNSKSSESEWHRQRHRPHWWDRRRWWGWAGCVGTRWSAACCCCPATLSCSALGALGSSLRNLVIPWSPPPLQWTVLSSALTGTLWPPAHTWQWKQGKSINRIIRWRKKKREREREIEIIVYIQHSIILSISV